MIERTVTVVPENGLHARPASQLVEAANSHESQVTIGPADGDSVNASSMLAVTSLGVETGEEARLTADGPDESAALDAIESILTTTE